MTEAGNPICGADPQIRLTCPRCRIRQFKFPRARPDPGATKANLGASSAANLSIFIVKISGVIWVSPLILGKIYAQSVNPYSSMA